MPGFLGLCVPNEYGGLGASFADYCRVSERARPPRTGDCAGVQHALRHDAPGRSDRRRPDMVGRRAGDARRPPAHICTAVSSSAGCCTPSRSARATRRVRRPGIQTVAEPVDGGFLVTGRKIFASLSEAADMHNIVALSPATTVCASSACRRPRDGLQIEGDWDPVGMRATLSRTLVFDRVFVPQENEWLPPGGFDQAATRWPHFYLTLSFTYVGLMRGVLDADAGVPAAERAPGDHPIKQHGWAELQVRYEQARALQHAVVDEAGVDPHRSSLRRAWASMVTVMEGAPEMASLATAGRWRAGAAEAGTARAPLPRRAVWSHDAAVERRGVPRTAGPRTDSSKTPRRRHECVTEWASRSAASQPSSRRAACTPVRPPSCCANAPAGRALVETSRLALASLGAQVAVVEVDHAGEPRPGADPLDGCLRGDRRSPGHDRRLRGGRVRRRLHGRGPAARARVGADPRRRGARADDLERAPRGVRAAPRSTRTSPTASRRPSPRSRTRRRCMSRRPPAPT